MTFLSARRLVPTCIISAAMVGALIAPGAASASEKGAHCSGVEIGGQGSSLQKLAQELWGPAFTTDKESTKSCAATGKPAILKYNPTGSGAGLKSWGVRKEGVAEHLYGPTNAFVGTDEAPNEAQKGEIEENENPLGVEPKNLESIPVLQAAVAVIVHLPTGCTEGTSESNKGRLVLNNSTLEEIWRGVKTKWNQITDNKDTLKCATKEEEESTIHYVVRKDGSGTTHIFKKYLGLINKETAFEVTNAKGESAGSKTWDEIASGAENQSWPTADAVERPAGNGGGEVVAKVAATPGSIGYANMADARANAAFIPPTGGPKKVTFWVPIQDKATTYADPASNKEAATLAESNCALEEYTNGKEAFPPANTRESWSAITTKTEEPHYTICGLTFDLSFAAFKPFENNGATKGGSTTASDYLQFILDVKGGQKLIKKHDYAAVSASVLKEAVKGATEVGF
jgi:ABC-type phosphate transport system substrate-binding protein